MANAQNLENKIMKKQGSARAIVQKNTYLKDLRMFKKLACIALAVIASSAYATSGGLDANGCHHTKKNEYHCHGLKLKNIKHNIPGESQSERMRRLNSQCVGMPNEGVCEGYAG